LMDEKIIQLEADDDILTIKGRLEVAQAERVILVVPKGCKGLSNPVRFDLLRRQANDMAMEVALVTRDRAVRALARRHGFPVYPSAERAQRATWRGPKARSSTAGRWGDLISIVLLLGCVLLLLAAGFLLIAPSAEVKLAPASTPVEALMEIKASPKVEEIDWAASKIPARAVEADLEGSAQIPTVSQKDVPDERAKGRVTFTNRTGRAVEIPQGTVVSTSAGTTIRFVTLEDITVPAGIGARAGVEIGAVDAGPGGNVRPFMVNTVEGPLALKVRVINGEPTSGGSVKRARAVTQADKERLKTLLLKKFHQEAETRLEGELEEKELIPPESIAVIVIDEIYDKFTDEVADTLGLEMSAVARGTAINWEDVETLARSALESKAMEGSRLVSQSLEIRQMGEAMKADEESIVFTVRATGIAAADINKEFVKGLIRGKSLREAKSSLSGLPLQGKPLIEISPSWFGRVPWLPFRIYVSGL